MRSDANLQKSTTISSPSSYAFAKWYAQNGSVSIHRTSVDELLRGITAIRTGSSACQPSGGPVPVSSASRSNFAGATNNTTKRGVMTKSWIMYDASSVDDVGRVRDRAVSRDRRPHEVRLREVVPEQDHLTGRGVDPRVRARTCDRATPRERCGADGCSSRAAGTAGWGHCAGRRRADRSGSRRARRDRRRRARRGPVRTRRTGSESSRMDGRGASMRKIMTSVACGPVSSSPWGDDVVRRCRTR